MNLHAVDWLMVRSQPNGLIGNPNHPGEAGRYMYGHGFSLMFLSCVYGEEEDSDRRKKMEDILTRADAYKDAIADAIRYARIVEHGDAVDRILIHLDRASPPSDWPRISR